MGPDVLWTFLQQLAIGLYHEPDEFIFSAPTLFI